MRPCCEFKLAITHHAGKRMYAVDYKDNMDVIFNQIPMQMCFSYCSLMTKMTLTVIRSVHLWNDSEFGLSYHSMGMIEFRYGYSQLFNFRC